MFEIHENRKCTRLDTHAYITVIIIVIVYVILLLGHPLERIALVFLFLFSGKQALIGNEHGLGGTAPKETIVHENGKVLTDNDDGNHRAYGILSEYYDNKNSRPLRLKKKLYEFYTAPITKFWANAVRRLFYTAAFIRIIDHLGIEQRFKNNLSFIDWSVSLNILQQYPAALCVF